MKRKHGFTLIELLVVVSIIALLVSILLPALNKAREQAKKVLCGTNLHSIFVGIMTYSSDNYGLALPHALYPDEMNSVPVFAPDATRYVRFNRWRDAAGDYQYRNFGILYQNKIVDNAEVFYCPAQKAKAFTIDIAITDPTREWGKIPGVDFPGTENQYNASVRQGYHYFPVKKHNPQWGVFSDYNEAREFLCTKAADFKANYAVITEPLQTEESFNGVQEKVFCAHTKNIEKDPLGLNACFGDGHVNFCMDDEIFDDAWWQPWNAGGPTASWLKFGNLWECLK